MGGSRPRCPSPPVVRVAPVLPGLQHRASKEPTATATASCTCAMPCHAMQCHARTPVSARSSWCRRRNSSTAVSSLTSPPSATPTCAVKTRFARARESSSSERCGQQQCSEAIGRTRTYARSWRFVFAQSSIDGRGTSAQWPLTACSAARSCIAARSTAHAAHGASAAAAASESRAPICSGDHCVQCSRPDSYR